MKKINEAKKLVLWRNWKTDKFSVKKIKKNKQKIVKINNE